AQQVWEGLYRRRAPLEDLTNVGRPLRARLAEALPLALSPVHTSKADDGETHKWLWGAGGDGASVETVLMRYPGRATVCVSTQAGCAMGCTFCATGQAGFERHLTAGEVVEQVARAQHASPPRGTGAVPPTKAAGAARERVGNVVFMGMGEPLANYDATWEAVVRLHDDFGISARHLTVSTVGVVPGMRRLATERLPVTLAVSLHAPDDELRNELVPLNRRYPLAEVLDAARGYLAASGRRLSFEYAMIGGVNDSPAQADALARRLRGFSPAAHVNLIPLNPTPGFAAPASPSRRVAAFAERLRAGGVNATVRRNRGTEIDAACGQLRTRRDAGRLGRPRPASAGLLRSVGLRPTPAVPGDGGDRDGGAPVTMG
ncbi:MAG TPA: 23S rRNA (adenine(2503)-C(2))-methyltransferase RlmN, partial [Acidimicrobiia bacterium]|nr:23S rRNA (adenine(2503)-C(2))-methyltransferase RlmN [Acidimicrobiia bacterium]